MQFARIHFKKRSMRVSKKKVRYLSFIQHHFSDVIWFFQLRGRIGHYFKFCCMLEIPDKPSAAMEVNW